jgi:hypothetical protein
MGLIGALLNQGIGKRNEHILNIWSLIGLVLITSFSTQILSSLLFEPMNTVNNFDELIQSNLSLVTGNWSYLYHAHQWARQFGDDEKLIYLHEKMTSFYDWDVSDFKKNIQLIFGKFFS